jgi:serine/threonine-protein kinase RsbW
MAAERPSAVPAPPALAGLAAPSAPAASSARPVGALITWARDFPGEPRQVGEARRFLAAVLAGSPLAGDAALCVSELASNAVLHSRSGAPGGSFTVRVSAGAGRVRLEVADVGGPWQGPPPPARPPAAPGRQQPRPPAARTHQEPRHPARSQDEQRGRGLAIVAALSTAWGVVGDRTGRVGWCEFELPVAGQRRRELAASG